MLVGTLVMAGFSVGKGKWGTGREEGVTESRKRVGQGLQMLELPQRSSHLPFSASLAPVPKVRTCHFCLLEDPAIGCISGSEKCTINGSSPCMVITIYSRELSPRKGFWGDSPGFGLPSSDK